MCFGLFLFPGFLKNRYIPIPASVISPISIGHVNDFPGDPMTFPVIILFPFMLSFFVCAVVSFCIVVLFSINVSLFFSVSGFSVFPSNIVR